MPHAKSLNELIQQANEFGEVRNWTNDDPNQLLTSAMIELGELAEHYQWKNKFEKLSSVEKKAISFEMVDVLLYLLRLAGKSELDLDVAFQEKIEKLALKYPIGSDYYKQKELYRKTGKNRLYD